MGGDVDVDVVAAPVVVRVAAVELEKVPECGTGARVDGPASAPLMLWVGLLGLATLACPYNVLVGWAWTVGPVIP